MSNLVKIVLFIVAQLGNKIIQYFSHRINGVAYHRATIRKGTSNSQLVVESTIVKACFPGTELLVTNPSAFLCWHERFVDTSYLLSSNITLLTIDESHAYFAECEEDHVKDLYNTRKHPFFFLAQRTYIRRLLKLSLDEFVKLGKEIGRPKCSITWIFHTSRCGSTALTQALNSMPRWIAVSESQHIVRHLTERQLRFNDLECYIKSKTFEDIVMAAINFIAKDFSTDQHLCMKMTAWYDIMAVLPLVKKRLPDSKVIVMYRDACSTVMSMWRTVGRSGEKRLNLMHTMMRKLSFKVINNRWKRVLTASTNNLVGDAEYYMVDKASAFFIIYLSWVSNIIWLRKYMEEENGPHMIINYDDFTQDKEAKMKDVIQFIDSPEATSLSCAIEGLNEDSQKFSPLSKEALSKESWEWDDTVVDWCNKVAEKYRLPKLGQKLNSLRS